MTIDSFITGKSSLYFPLVRWTPTGVYYVMRREAIMKVGRTAVWPVSYTHLRAHETVLDLVCRLLLEKNKYHLLIILHRTTLLLYYSRNPAI